MDLLCVLLFKSWSHVEILVRKVQNVQIGFKKYNISILPLSQTFLSESRFIYVYLLSFLTASYIPYPSLWLGGTVDTTGHKVLLNGTLKEIDSASGGPWGGKLVNDAFGEFIAELVKTTLCHTNFVSVLPACVVFNKSKKK